MLTRIIVFIFSFVVVLTGIANADEDFSACSTSTLLKSSMINCFNDDAKWNEEMPNGQIIQVNEENAIAFTTALVEQLETSIGNSTLSINNGNSATLLDAEHYGKKLVSIIDKTTASNVAAKSDSTSHAQPTNSSFDAFASFSPLFEDNDFKPFNDKKDTSWK